MIPGTVAMSGREDTGADGVSKYLRGSRDQVFGTVDRYGYTVHSVQKINIAIMACFHEKNPKITGDNRHLRQLS